MTISQLAIYPVKSLRGIQLESSLLTSQGLQWDRHWMVINESNRFVTQRQVPEMIFIKTGITESHLILSKASMENLSIPLKFNGNQQQIATQVWGEHCEVMDEGEDASVWLTEALKSKQRLRLVRMAKEPTRTQSKPEIYGESTHTFFADAAPYLVCNEASLELLNQQLVAKGIDAVTMERFRPNIVIDGADSFAEHKITRLKHNNYEFKLCYPCQRCVVPTIDIDTAIRHPQQQPFLLLGELNPMPDKPKAPAFGENAILINGNQKMIRISDKLSQI